MTKELAPLWPPVYTIARMCGRFDFHGDVLDIEQAFGALDLVTRAPVPCYNIAPTLSAGIVERRDGVQVLDTCTFGHRRAKGGLWVNVRVETLAARNSAVRRCAVPANGFYEWHAEGKSKQPYYFSLPEFPVFALAGIRIDDAFVVITTAPNAAVGAVHDRMPVLLTAAAIGTWLQGEKLDAAPYAQPMARVAVGRAMNDPRHDGADCIAPL